MEGGMRVLAKLIMLACVVLAPVAAYAQGSIAGVVKDTSGAVLPGVTVEAASPALIEKVRSASTDGTGQYLITNLTPGTYTVTYTLAGFNTVKREGIELTGSFTASINIELRVGALEETITVTGETPIVDVQSAARQRVLDQQVLDALPSSRALTTLTGLTPGVTMSNQDVGGGLGDGVGTGGLRVRGVGDTRLLVGGVVANTTYRIAHGAYNLGAYQEVVVDTGGTGAEQEEGGVRINVVPRDGGNTFRGSFFGAFANESMAGNNFTQNLKDRGLRTPDSLKDLLDVNPSFGGPIKRDKVWFNVAARYSAANNFSSVFFNKNAGNPNVWTYEPDLSKGPAWNENTLKNITARVTWQATAKNKFAFAYDPSDLCDCPRGLSATTSPEANVTNYVITNPNRNISAEWTAPLTSRLLLEGNILSRWSFAYRAQVNPFFSPSPVPLIKVTEQSTGLQYRGTPNARLSQNKLLFWRVAASYITGAHAVKTGFVFGRIPNNDYTFTLDAPIEYRFNNGVPNRLTMYATPFREVTNLDADHGLFVQDKWTVKRLTVSGGLRYTYLRIKFPETVVGPGAFTPNRNIVVPDANGATWHELSPRSSLAFDVFGTGKTALKLSLNRYLGAQDRSTLFGAPLSPVGSLVTSTNRSWTDANRDFVPDCNLLNPLANGECGVMSNTDFGSARPGRAYDRDTTHGWGRRNGNWQFATGVQHEILPRVSADVTYWRTWFVNLAAIDARALGPSDFDTFSITAPIDPRLPGGGGSVISGFYDIKPAKAGVPGNELVTFADNFGKQIEHWNGIDVTINARPRPGILLQGGTSTERRTSDTCDLMAKLPETTLGGATAGVTGSPTTLGAANPLQYCHVQGKFLTQAKLLGSITVPRIDVQVSASLQSLPGPEIAATYVASNAEVLRSLGRNLSASATSVTVNLVEPRSMYGERMNQIDLRFGKILKFGRTRATASLDLYNALNSSAVLAVSNSFATWQQPQSILSARFAKVVMQFDF
jgi:hypothetical protein